MYIDELYKEKGRLITEIEISQSQLANINQQIINFVNSKNIKNEGSKNAELV